MKSKKQERVVKFPQITIVARVTVNSEDAAEAITRLRGLDVAGSVELEVPAFAVTVGT